MLFRKHYINSKLKNFENGELVQKNAIFMDYLQSGIPVRYFVDGEERSSIVYLVDYYTTFRDMTFVSLLGLEILESEKDKFAIS
jgi:putative type I restriction enzyme HindVIIP R protein